MTHAPEIPRPRPRLLDLFAGEGGSAHGYAQAGFDVVGVDIEPQPRYPFEFHQGDASTWPLDGFDAVHASPPCHDHSVLAGRTGLDHGTAWLLPHSIARLRESGLPYVVENVAGPAARRHMDGALTLCGSMFGLGAVDGGIYRILRRHRLFVTSFPALAPPDQCSGRPVGGVYGDGGAGQQTRGYRFHRPQAVEAMGIDWMTGDGRSQAIPPAFTRFLGEQLIGAWA
jgi:DNA (cytosine-5)-methyltransferase 1